MREVDTATQFYKSVVGILVANHGQFVAYLDASSLDEALTSIARGTIAGIAAINVEFVGAICHVQVAIVVLLTLIVEQVLDFALHTIVDILVVGLGQELGDGDVGHADVALVLATGHLSGTLVFATLTDDSHDVAFLQSELLEVALRTDTIDIGFARVVGNVDVAILSLSHTLDDTGQAILRIAHLGSEELLDGSGHDGALLGDADLAGVVLLAISSLEDDGSLTVATLVGQSVECDGITSDSVDEQPILGILRNLNADAVALAGDISHHVATLDGQRIGSAQ